MDYTGENDAPGSFFVKDAGRGQTSIFQRQLTTAKGLLGRSGLPENSGLYPVLDVLESMETLHPSPATLHEYARGVLTDADSMRLLEQHVDQCDSCRSILETAPDDSFLQTLRKSICSPAHARGNGLCIGGYELREELGRGGMGIVYRATQLNLGRDVALKRIAHEVISSEEMRLRFRREAELMASVKHRAVVQVLDYGEYQRSPYLVLELLSNRTLAHVIRSAPLKPRIAARLLATVAQGLAAVHAVGIVHRDIKPGNILLGDPETLVATRSERDSPSDDSRDPPTSVGDPRLSDFGLAFSPEHQLTLARTGLLLGTPSYMAPEQIRSEFGPADHRADLYAMGATLYECLTGRPPFRAPTPLETMEQACHQQPIPPRRILPGIPLDLQTICLKCLAKRPEDRYATASQLSDDLERFLQGQPIQARPISRTRRIIFWSRQNPWRAALVVVAAISLLSAIAGIAWHNQQLRLALTNLEHEQGETISARAQADTNYQEARRTIRRMLDYLKERSLDETPRVQALIEQQSSEAIRFLSDLTRVQSPIPTDVYADLIDAYVMHGNSCYLLGKFECATESFGEAIQLSRQLVDLSPQPENQLRLSEALVKNSLAIRSAPDVDIEAAETQLQQAAEIIDQLASGSDDSPEVINQAAWVQHQIGTLRLQQQRYDLAATAFEASANKRLQIAESTSDSRYTISAVESITNLALCYASLGDTQKALAWHAKADESYQQLLEQGFGSTELALSIAANNVNWCGSLLAVGDFQQCIEIASQSLDQIRPILAREPQHINARDRMYGLLGNRALAQMQLGQFDQSYADWSELLPYSPDGAAHVSNAIVASLTAAYASRTDDALTQLSRLPALPQPLPDDRYNMACVYAICANHLEQAADPAAATSQTRAASIKEKAMEILTQLEQEQYFNEATIAQLQQDTDLDGLRMLPEFAALIERLRIE